jgi:hypothetical protein
MHRPRAGCEGRTIAEAVCAEIDLLRRGLREAADTAIRAGDDEAARELRLSYIALRELIARTDVEVATHLCDPDGDRAIARQVEGLRRSARLMAPEDRS